MRARLVTILLSLAVGVAGCGDDGDGGVALPKGPTDMAKARAIVLKASDFPPGWTSEPAGTGTSEETGDNFRSCMGLLPQASPVAESPTFNTTGSMTVDSSATVGLSVRLVDQDFAAFAGEKALPCVLERFDAQAKRQTEATFGPGKAERLGAAHLGDATSAIRINSIAVAGDQQIPFFLDLVVVKKGRVGVTFSFANAPDPFPSDLATELARKVVDRA
ncbi:MAG: hypothetical protein ACR2MO_05305 [Acidimicrobiales bacterium]